MIVARPDRNASPLPPYEVRCPRCDVTFPIQTRVCVHCGGRTAATSERFLAPTSAEFEIPDDSMGRAPTTVEPVDETPFIFGSPGDLGSPGDTESGSDEFGVEREAQPPGFARTLMRNVGGLIWVLLLIGFSIARSCEQ